MVLRVDCPLFLKIQKNCERKLYLIWRTLLTRWFNMLRSRIGEHLRVCRYKREYIIKELGISQNTLSNWVTGKTYPTIDKAYVLAELLEVNVEDLYERNKKDPHN